MLVSPGYRATSAGGGGVDVRIVARPPRPVALVLEVVDLRYIVFMSRTVYFILLRLAIKFK